MRIVLQQSDIVFTMCLILTQNFRKNSIMILLQNAPPIQFINGLNQKTAIGSKPIAVPMVSLFLSTNDGQYDYLISNHQVSAYVRQ